MDVMKDYMPASEEKRIEAIKNFYKGKVREEQLWLGCVWYKIYEVMCKKEVWLVTAKDNLPVCQDIGIRAFDALEDAYAEAMKRCGKDAQVAFIPYGRYTVVRPW